MSTILLRPCIDREGDRATFSIASSDSDGAPVVEQGRAVSLSDAEPTHRGALAYVVVPASCLSWHRVKIPRTLQRQASKVQAFLQGSLEAELLTKASELHFALEPKWKSKEDVWVAICDKQWLAGVIQEIEAAGYTVARLVPEVFPSDEARAIAITSGTSNQLWMSSHALGVWCLPLSSWVGGVTMTTLWPPSQAIPTHIHAEPQAARVLQALDTPNVVLMDSLSHWSDVLATDWDLAQGAFYRRSSSAWVERVSRSAAHLLRAPAWRNLRIATCALLCVNVVGLNAWSLTAHSQWRDQEQAMQTILQATFPDVTLIIDAPKQMRARMGAMGALGAASQPSDFLGMLYVLDEVLPKEAGLPTRLTYTGGALEVSGLVLSEPALAQVRTALQAKQLQWSVAADGYTLAPTQGAQR
jgi:general secretion pathway protein L